MARQDPKLTILNLLENNWDNTNTSISYDPLFHTGRYNQSAQNPQVTVTRILESPIGGAPSGYQAFDPSGAGAIQEMDGAVRVWCWSDYDAEENVNPKDLTDEFRGEIERIVTTNQTTATDLRYISLGRHKDDTESEKTPIVYKHRQDVNFGYAIRP